MEVEVRNLFEIARQAGLVQYAGDRLMERKLRRAGTPGKKAYLRVFPEYRPGDGNRVTLAFRRPKGERFEAHSVGFVKDAPIGAWAVTALAITQIKL